MELLNMIPVWLIIIVAAVVILTIIAMAVTYFKNRTLEDIRADVYQLILKAEHIYEESGSGKQKMKWVVSQARKLLPQWAQALISEDTLMDIIQIWFDGVKDLLDDGKMNNSSNMRIRRAASAALLAFIDYQKFLHSWRGIVSSRQAGR